MTRKYKLHSVVSMTSPALLERIFVHLDADTAPLAGPKPADAQALEAFVEALADLIHAKVDIVFQDIFTLACKDGLAVIDRIATTRRQKHWEKPFLAVYGIDASPYSQAAWLYLEYPDLFGAALEALEFSRLTWGHARTNLKQIVPVFTLGMQKKFEDALCASHDVGLSRFCFCETKMQEYGDGVYYFPVDLSGYVRTDSYSSDSRLEALKTESLYRFVFAYDSLAGTLRLHARTVPKTKDDLAEIFIRQVLHQEPSSEIIVVSDLSPLRSKKANLGYFPDDFVKISVVESVFAGGGANVLFRITHSQDSLVTLAEEYLSIQRLRYADVRLVKCNLHFEFLPGAPCGEGSCTIELKHGQCIDLGYLGKDREGLIHKYIKLLRLEHADASCPTSR